MNEQKTRIRLIHSGDLSWGEVAEWYPDAEPGTIKSRAEHLFRFVYEMKTGDLMVSSSKQDHQVHLRLIQDPSPSHPFAGCVDPNLQPVTAVHAFLRLPFTEPGGVLMDYAENSAANF